MRALLSAIHHPDYLPDYQPEAKELSDVQRRLLARYRSQHRRINRDMYSVTQWGKGLVDRKRADIIRATSAPREARDWYLLGDLEDFDKAFPLYRVFVINRFDEDHYFIAADMVLPGSKTIQPEYGLLHVVTYPVGQTSGDRETNPRIGEEFIFDAVTAMGQKTLPLVEDLRGRDCNGNMLKCVITDMNRIPRSMK